MGVYIRAPPMFANPHLTEGAIQGNFVSVWGSVTKLRDLPEPFGLRICEIEAYAEAFDTRLEDRPRSS